MEIKWILKRKLAENWRKELRSLKILSPQKESVQNIFRGPNEPKET